VSKLYIDGSARVQSVMAVSNLRLYSLLDAFAAETETGLGLLLVKVLMLGRKPYLVLLARS
jgi:predicted NodU family carbamoyl transferase